MELSSLHTTILDVLSHQSEEYLCDPGASAFVAIGLDNPEVIIEALHELQDAEYVEFYIDYVKNEVVQLKLMSNGEPEKDDEDNVIPIRDEETGEPLTQIIELPTDSGWIITQAGRDAFNSV